MQGFAHFIALFAALKADLLTDNLHVVSVRTRAAAEILPRYEVSTAEEHYANTLQP